LEKPEIGGAWGYAPGNAISNSLNNREEVTPDKKMRRLTTIPKLELSIVSVTYSGLLLVTLTTYFFWPWSGMASLGTFYLIFGAPVAMGIIAFKHRKTKESSMYHRWVYYLALLYFVVAPLVFLTLFNVSDK
jgi:formate-dependent nitrite reductase membrane component NrfD